MCYLRVSGWLTRSASAHRSARSYQQQQVWYDAMQCTDMRSHVVPDVVSRFPQTTTHWPTRPGCTPPARAVNKHPRLHASSCASITQSTFVDHSTPPQVPQYCIPDTLAFKTSLSPLISGLHLADPFFEPCHVSHLAQIHHPCLSPTAPSPSARYPHAARCAMDAHHFGTPTPRNGFACQPRSCILNPAFRATSASWSANQASLPHRHPIYAARNDASSCSMPCLELHLTARSCSCCSCLLPCLKALDKQLISFEVRRHGAASCAIRHEHAGCRWLKTPPFGVCSN